MLFLTQTKPVSNWGICLEDLTSQMEASQTCKVRLTSRTHQENRWYIISDAIPVHALILLRRVRPVFACWSLQKSKTHKHFQYLKLDLWAGWKAERWGLLSWIFNELQQFDPLNRKASSAWANSKFVYANASVTQVVRPCLPHVLPWEIWKRLVVVATLDLVQADPWSLSSLSHAFMDEPFFEFLLVRQNCFATPLTCLAASFGVSRAKVRTISSLQH